MKTGRARKKPGMNGNATLLISILVTAIMLSSPKASVSSGRITIRIKDFSFNPAEITVRKGTEVT